MTVNVGVMQLPVTEDPDPVRTYLNGTAPSGGLWTALTRASNHDHSGGLSGVQLTATAIPDGSITAAKLDPAVLLPYALVDGSKPFTGVVTMNADQLIRDTLRFGAKPAGVADATLARTGAGALRVDTHLGVGVNPAAFSPANPAVQVGQGGVVKGAAADTSLQLTSNAYHDGAWKAITTGPASLLSLATGNVSVYTAPSATAGAAPAFVQRALIAPTGTLTLTPDAGVDALVLTPASGNPVIRAGGAQFLVLAAGGSSVNPATDNTYSFGTPSARWNAGYFTAGIVTGSSQEFKEDITPLSPTECYQAAKDVRWYEYAYLPPAYIPPEPPPDIVYDAADDNETKAEKKASRDEAEAKAKAAHLKMLVETAPARHQRGFVFGGAEAKDETGEPLPPVPDLFGLSDRQSTTPQADLATLGCAMQEVIRRLEALEGAAA